MIPTPGAAIGGGIVLPLTSGDSTLFPGLTHFTERIVAMAECNEVSKAKISVGAVQDSINAVRESALHVMEAARALNDRLYGTETAPPGAVAIDTPANGQLDAMLRDLGAALDYLATTENLIRRV